MSTAQTLNHFDEALKLTEGRGALFETARELSTHLRDSELSAAVIGGVAVVAHGYWRTTRDIDFLVESPLPEFALFLQSHGFSHDPVRKEFVRDGLPVHLVPPTKAGTGLTRTLEIQGILTIPLSDLIGMKLRSGTKNLVRAQDLGDVIGLIRHHRLTSQFAGSLEKDLRPAFRKLVKAIAADDQDS